MTRTLSVAAAAVIALTPLAARGQGTDPNWNAWIGCWASGPMDAVAVSLSRPVCVVPAGPSGVDIVAVRDGREVSREHVDASGLPQKADREGCTGSQTARWSADRRRVYLTSTHQCSGGATRSSSGLMAMTPEGEWLDIVSVTSGEDTGVRVLRHRPMAEPSGLPSSVAQSLQKVSRPAVDERRTLAGAPIGLSDIVEASRQVSDSVVAAWLNDVRQRLNVNAASLRELAAAGVPDRVVDMMVGLAYPDAFSVPPSPTRIGALTGGEPGPGFGGADAGDFAGVDSGCGVAFSLYGWGCSPFGYSPLGFLPFGYLPYVYSRYNYSPYGFYPGAYGGWYAGGPAVIGPRPADTNAHGRVVNGHGYSSGDGGSAASPPASAGGNAGASAGSSGGGSVGATSDGGGRTAHPR